MSLLTESTPPHTNARNCACATSRSALHTNAILGLSVEKDPGYAAQQEHISKKLKVAPTLMGDKYLAQIREILASKLGLKRSGTQVKFHESFLQAISRILYRSDGAQADMSAIMQREKWDDLQQQVCCLTPRRFGKVR